MTSKDLFIVGFCFLGMALVAQAEPPEDIYPTTDFVLRPGIGAVGAGAGEPWTLPCVDHAEGSCAELERYRRHAYPHYPPEAEGQVLVPDVEVFHPDGQTWREHLYHCDKDKKQTEAWCAHELGLGE